jgi:hypothetical protein
VIEPRFAHAGVYHDERLPISDDGKSWAFADATGELAIPDRFSFAFNYLSGAASVERTVGVWDVIDREGTPLALWRGVTREGRIRASTGRSYRGPGFQFEPQRGPNTTWGLLDEQGNTVVEPTYHGIGDVIEGFCFAHHADGTTVYLDRDGQVALGPFPGAGRGFSNGWARLKSEGRWTFIDRTGAIVLEPEYLEMEPFREERALFKANDGGLYGFIDRAGQVVTRASYLEARSFAGGMAAVATGDPTDWRSKRWGFVDATGAEVIAPAFVRTTDFHGDNPIASAAVYPEGSSVTLHGIIDRRGAWILPPVHADIGQFTDGVAKFVHSAPTTSGRGKEGLLDATGKILADGYTFVDVERGFPAAVNKGGRHTTNGTVAGGAWGFIDASGAEIIPCRFTLLGSAFGAGYGFATVAVETTSTVMSVEPSEPSEPAPERADQSDDAIKS